MDRGILGFVVQVSDCSCFVSEFSGCDVALSGGFRGFYGQVSSTDSCVAKASSFSGTWD